MLLSTGERVSMALLSIAIQARGFEAISFTGSQSGILTNDRHFEARIIEVRPHRIEDELARGKIVIVAGYQGVSYKREITTLGRGGSDTTAVAVAAALLAERCEIYSDVDGVYSADPRAVPDARHLPELDHAMLQEMAESGAKVVCAQAVEWARRANIAIYARSTFDSDDGTARETVIRRFSPTDRLSARAITAEPKIAFATLGDAREMEAVMRVATEAKFALKDLAMTERSASFVVPLLNVPDWPLAARSLASAAPSLALTEDVATVSVVGDGLGASMEPTIRFGTALRTEGIAPKLLTATPLRISAVIPRAMQAAAERILHEAFVAS
jgi:aspartate kinase